MRNKILAISASVVAAALCVFSICFSFAVPQTKVESSFPQVDDYSRPYYPYGYFDESEFSMASVAHPEWIEIYKTLYESFITADDMMVDPERDVIIINTTQLKYIESSQCNDVTDYLISCGYNVIDASLFTLEEQGFFSDESTGCLIIDINEQTYTTGNINNIYITGNGKQLFKELAGEYWLDMSWSWDYAGNWVSWKPTVDRKILTTEDLYYEDKERSRIKSETIEPDWVKIYTETYKTFILSEKNRFKNADCYVIHTAMLEYVNDEQKKEIFQNLETIGVDIIDITSGDFYNLRQNTPQKKYVSFDILSPTYGNGNSYDRVFIDSDTKVYYADDADFSQSLNWNLINSVWTKAEYNTYL
jgi:hypothetical protein